MAIITSGILGTLSGPLGSVRFRIGKHGACSFSPRWHRDANSPAQRILRARFRIIIRVGAGIYRSCLVPYYTVNRPFCNALNPFVAMNIPLWTELQGVWCPRMSLGYPNPLNLGHSSIDAVPGGIRFSWHPFLYYHPVETDTVRCFWYRVGSLATACNPSWTQYHHRNTFVPIGDIHPGDWLGGAYWTIRDPGLPTQSTSLSSMWQYAM